MDIKKNAGFKLIVAIVNKCDILNVIKLSKDEGASSSTIMSRGNSTDKYFNFSIEPEQEIVLILVNIKNAENVFDRVNGFSKLDKDKKSNVFLLDMNKSF